MTKKELEDLITRLAEGEYYSNIETKEHWEPFEYYSPDQVEGFIGNLEYVLTNFAAKILEEGVDDDY
tara:strand:- start:652 stop:852 length:201 start_codon:yes stop_codon:yes gene_type:complete